MTIKAYIPVFEPPPARRGGLSEVFIHVCLFVVVLSFFLVILGTSGQDED